MEQALELIKPLFEVYAGKLGIAVQVVGIVGTLRMVIKPIMSLVQVYVDLTPTESDDHLPQKIKESKAYKMAVYFFDWLASIKLPK